VYTNVNDVTAMYVAWICELNTGCECRSTNFFQTILFTNNKVILGRYYIRYLGVHFVRAKHFTEMVPRLLRTFVSSAR